MNIVIAKALEYHSVMEELPTIANKTYLCRVVIDSNNGRFRVFIRQ